MKRFRTIAKEISKLMDNPSIYIGDDDNWKIYENYCCIFNDGMREGNYVCITFSQRWRGNKKRIEISHNTDNPEEWVAIIKGIEPSAEVTYTKKILKETTV